MADIVDNAQGNEEMALKSALSKRKAELPYTGQCWNCEEPAEGNFCCKECREDFEHRNRMSGRRFHGE